MKHYTFKVGHRPNLKDLSTHIKDFYESEEKAEVELKESQKRIASFQERLYAQKEWSVLLILQGMDTAGKDGLIKYVLTEVDPPGCTVTSFKKPSPPELAHDFLWRTHLPVPTKGHIGVFNRSYYEDVVAPFVHPEILEKSQLPKKVKRSKDLLKHRCADIVNFEKYLLHQGILVIKIFLNLSKEEQKSRLIARIEDPDKNWKFDDADIKERAFWSKYQKAYDYCLEHTNHKDAPWYVIPADDKLTSRLIASKIITEALAELKLEFPAVDANRKRTLKKFKRNLEKS